MTTGLRTFNVLFLCADNSVRSILAEALLNRLGAGRFQAFSAGYGVAEAVNPYALALLEKINYNPDRVCAKQMVAVMDGADPGFDFIIRLSPDRRGSARMPQFSGAPVVVDWHMPDPADVSGSSGTMATACADIFNHLAARIDTLANLSEACLTGPQIQGRLDRMGEDSVRLAA
jgi:arsenate reductase